MIPTDQAVIAVTQCQPKATSVGRVRPVQLRPASRAFSRSSSWIEQPVGGGRGGRAGGGLEVGLTGKRQVVMS